MIDNTILYVILAVYVIGMMAVFYCVYSFNKDAERAYDERLKEINAGVKE
jgi:hypothetical protein